MQKLRGSARRLVREWVEQNRPALEGNWQRARRDMSLEKIHGLDAELGHRSFGLHPFRLQVRFQDGAGGVHDCAALLESPGPMPAPLRDPDFFAQVMLDYGAPTWPNGYDMCPDWLRLEMERAGELLATAA